MPSETTYRGYVIKNRKGLKHWEPLLEEWLLCIERYCRIWKGGDAPYIHKERANIGLLSAAAWRCGWIALEEFRHEKGGRSGIRIADDAHADVYTDGEPALARDREVRLGISCRTTGPEPRAYAQAPNRSWERRCAGIGVASRVDATTGPEGNRPSAPSPGRVRIVRY
jgi:hypothetical protein